MRFKLNKMTAFGFCAILFAQPSHATPYTSFVVGQKNSYLSQRPNVQAYPLATATNVAQMCSAGTHVAAAADGSIVITGNGNCTIQGLRFRPINQAYALQILAHNTGQITIKDNYINAYHTSYSGVGSGSLNGRGILVYHSSNVLIEDNHFEGTSYASVYVFGNPSTSEEKIKIINNKVLNTQLSYEPLADWTYQSYFTAFLNINGPGHEIKDNKILNVPGESFQTDVFNIYQSEGTQASPILATGNVYMGPGSLGFYNHWGAGMQLGDHSSGISGGQWIQAKSNLLLEPGQVGININGGLALNASFNILNFTENRPGYMPMPQSPQQPGVWNTLTTTWTPMSLVNYHNDGTPNSGHVVKGNQTYCANCTNTIYNAFLPLPPSQIIDNIFGVPATMPAPALTDFAKAGNSFMANKSCTAQVITWDNENCYAKATSELIWQGKLITNQAAGRQGQAYVACQNGGWVISSNWCSP